MEFLLDYYIWILAVLGIVIVTIIGFLVDSKQKRKKQELGEKDNKNEVQTVQPFPEDINKEGSLTEVKNEQVIDDNNIEVKSEDNSDKSLNNIVQPTAQLVEQPQDFPDNMEVQKENTLSQNVSLSGQTPHFEPKEVIMPQPLVNNENVVTASQPMSSVPFNQTVQSRPVPQQTQQQFYSTYNQQQINPYNTNINNQMPINNMQQLQNQNVMLNNQVYGGNQAVNYQNIPNVASGVVQPSSNMVNQPVATSLQTNQPTNPQVESQMPGLGINFVTGETSNKQNDDTWNL